MKIRRYKKLNKTLSFFNNNYGFRQPFQLLVDGTFCYAALNNKVNIADNLPRYLQGEIKLITTQCAIMEMETLGSKVIGALKILKQYIVHKCGHKGKPITGAKCLYSMLGQQNSNHYILASQDRDLQDKARLVPGVPLLYLHIKTPVLEKQSEASIQRANEKIAGLGQSEIEALKALKREEKPVSKKKKKKGPNPLSCKKSKKKLAAGNPIQKKETTTETEKKKRKRIKIPKHVKESLVKMANKDNQ